MLENLVNILVDFLVAVLINNAPPMTDVSTGAVKEAGSVKSMKTNGRAVILLKLIVLQAMDVHQTVLTTFRTLFWMEKVEVISERSFLLLFVAASSTETLVIKHTANTSAVEMIRKNVVQEIL